MANTQNKKEIKKENNKDKLSEKSNNKKSELLKDNKKDKSLESLSINFSINMDDKGLSGNITCNPPKDMSEEDKVRMEKLIKDSIDKMSIFMNPREHIGIPSMLRDIPIIDRKFNNLFDVFNDKKIYNERREDRIPHFRIFR